MVTKTRNMEDSNNPVKSDIRNTNVYEGSSAKRDSICTIDSCSNTAENYNHGSSDGIVESNNIDRLSSQITIQEVIDELRNYDDTSEYRSFIVEILGTRTLTGSASDYHNLTVSLTKKDLYDVACNVLEIGLSNPGYSKDVDLLADYLIYGIKCGREESCERYYQTLLRIPKCRWKWRAFNFSIDYLLHKAEALESEKELIIARKEMLQLINAYKKYFPSSEDCYVSESEIYSFMNQRTKEKDCLLLAYNKISRAPQASLHLADIAFEEGNYKEARDYLSKAKITGIGKNSRINLKYVYYLDMMCLISILHEKELKDRESSPYEREDIEELYRNYSESETILSDENSGFSEILSQQIEIFEKKTGIPYDPVQIVTVTGQQGLNSRLEKDTMPGQMLS